MTFDESIENACAGKTRYNLPVVYISGPMSGIKDFNFPAFNEAARRLRFLGFPVLNPADFGYRDGQPYRDCIFRDLAAVGAADVVLLLNGWVESAGANIEFDVAFALDIPCLGADVFVDKIIYRFIEPREVQELDRLDNARESLIVVRVDHDLSVIMTEDQADQMYADADAETDADAEPGEAA